MISRAFQEVSGRFQRVLVALEALKGVPRGALIGPSWIQGVPGSLRAASGRFKGSQWPQEVPGDLWSTARGLKGVP